MAWIARCHRDVRRASNRNQISFEPGFGPYQRLARKIEAPFSMISFFLQFLGFESDSRTRAKTRYAPNSGWNAFWSHIPISRDAKNQRAANGGLDPSWLGLRFLGHPDFQSRGPQIPIFKGFGDLWTENRCAPKNAKSNHNGSNPPVAALWKNSCRPPCYQSGSSDVSH